MSRADYNLEEMIRRVHTDVEPDPANKVKLRWQMLSAFNRTARRQAFRQRIRRKVMQRPLKKLAAVLIIITIIAIHYFKRDTADDGPQNSPDPIATPRHDPASGLAPIEIKLPNPIQVGTLEDNRVANLEKQSGKPRPPFLAPAGTKNVALRKPVCSSDEEPIIGQIEMITDGDKEGFDGSYVELGPFVQHVTIDLQAEYNIYAVVIWHYHKLPRVYFDVVVQLADDPDFITNVRTVFNNDIDNSIGLGVGKDKHYMETHEGKLIDAKGVQARYLRLYSRGNTGSDLNHYIEVEVYGKPAA